MTIPDVSSLPLLDPFEALIRLFRDLPRKGPGTTASTLQALEACRPLPQEPAVLDLGCGSGASSLVLAQALGVQVTAIDACAPFLEELKQRAREQGLNELVRPVCKDIGHLDFPPGSFDLVWSEGAIYNLGWEAGLKTWKPLVRSGGFLALTEAVWFTDSPPEAARNAWSEWYPAIGIVEQGSALASSLGFEVVETFRLPREAWLEYFAPVEQRCREWASGADPALARTIAELEAEIELYRAFGDSYGYAFYILRVP
jgi:serine/threonine-protein kinase HipA